MACTNRPVAVRRRDLLCLAGAGIFAAALRPTAADAAMGHEPTDPAALRALRRAYPDGWASAYWFTDPSPARPEALAIVYVPFPGSNSFGIDVMIWRRDGGGWHRLRTIDDLYGEDPRDVHFSPGSIEVTMTTLRPSDGRCCPTGTTRYRIDRRTGGVRKIR